MELQEALTDNLLPISYLRLIKLNELVAEVSVLDRQTICVNVTEKKVHFRHQLDSKSIFNLYFATKLPSLAKKRRRSYKLLLSVDDKVYLVLVDLDERRSEKWEVFDSRDRFRKQVVQL
mmetsp:Transcript_17527/g.29554  ORF Transcript_17527/g.29554 Transcript_17527/m.29554 type:complete len:119 (+) Transcript_17527:982-1338(+)